MEDPASRFLHLPPIGDITQSRLDLTGGSRRIIALTEMVGRMAEDHANAELLRAGLEALGIQVDRGGILTDIIRLDVSPGGGGQRRSSRTGF